MGCGKERSDNNEQAHEQPVCPPDPSERLASLGGELGAIVLGREPEMESQSGGHSNCGYEREEE